MQLITCPLLSAPSGLIASWVESGFARVEFSDSPFIWWGEPGNVLLYHRDTLQWFSDRVRYKAALFANPSPPLNGGRNSSWLYWPRHYELTNRYHALKPLAYAHRKFNCAFIGGYENCLQRAARYVDYWKPACDVFEVGKSRKAPATKLTGAEYLRVMRQARYGLCLPGYGGKCQREIECFALGTVPIFTPGVSLSYFNKLTVGLHYLCAESPEEVTDLVNTVSEEQWTMMSTAGMLWYDSNVMPVASFKTTQQIIETLLQNPTR